MMIRLQSLPGLVEENVSRLRVLGDVWGKPIKLLDGLGVNFLHNRSETLFTDNTIVKRTNRWVKEHQADINRLRQRVTHLHNVIIKQQPEAMTLHYGDVMTSIRAAEKETKSVADVAVLKFPECTTSVCLQHKHTIGADYKNITR